MDGINRACDLNFETSSSALQGEQHNAIQTRMDFIACDFADKSYTFTRRIINGRFPSLRGI